MADHVSRTQTAIRAGAPVPHHGQAKKTLLVGDSEATRSLRAEINTIAPRGATVLIEGETGVGKEMAAREIHACSPRAARLFVPVDCTAFSNELIESQLFGHVKGAYTGAVVAGLLSFTIRNVPYRHH
jgi:transcriptional regulator with GAF, ATPase, and Fis domain